jgi:hypothetical protein
VEGSLGLGGSAAGTALNTSPGYPEKVASELAKLTGEAARSDQMKCFLETCAKFYQYSWNNQFLIFLTNPNATHVAGYKRWLSLNRFVRRTWDPILAPIVIGQDREHDKPSKQCRQRSPMSSISPDRRAIPEVERALYAWLSWGLLAFCRVKGTAVIEELYCTAQDEFGAQSPPVQGPRPDTRNAHELMHHKGIRPISPRELEVGGRFVVGDISGSRISPAPTTWFWDADGEAGQSVPAHPAVAVEIISAVSRMLALTKKGQGR